MRPAALAASLLLALLPPGAVVAADDEQIEQKPSLRVQQSSEPGFFRSQGLNVLGQQSLQEASPILTGYRDERSAGEGGDGGICRHGSAVKGSAGGAPAAGAL